MTSSGIEPANVWLKYLRYRVSLEGDTIPILVRRPEGYREDGEFGVRTGDKSVRYGV
jgi:hypothetical protein